MVVEGTVEARPTPDVDALLVDPWQKLAQARIGQTVGGRLQLERVLGVGGTASVYAARHRNGRALAVKVLHSELAHHPGIRQRFLAEGYAANKVDHPDAVAVLDEGEDAEGNVFIVMELLRGHSLLEHLLEQGPLPKAHVVSVALRVLDVLAKAHDRGVVHRDIKPANLFQTEEGAIKVLDFGIARVQDSPGAFATRPGTTLGTPAFMAPELAAGRLDQLDALTDLWAVGATMFQLLTGEAVHPSDSDNQLLVRAATQPARSLAILRPDLEPWLVKIVDRALCFERRGRWPNARAMSAALAEPALRTGLISALDGTSPTRSSDIETAPEMALPLSRPLPPRRMRNVLAWALALLLTLAAFAGALAMQHRNTDARLKSTELPLPPQAPTQAASNASLPATEEPSAPAPRNPSTARPVGTTPAKATGHPATPTRPLAPPALIEPARAAPASSAQPANPLFFPTK